MASQPDAYSTHRIHKSRAVNHRKIRKGTFSCWECKRRKTRCQFQPSSSVVCLSCEKHGSLCVSQTSEEPDRNASDENVKRLADIEMLVEQFIRQRTHLQGKDTQAELPYKDINSERRDLREHGEIERGTRVRTLQKNTLPERRSPLTLLRVTDSLPSKFGSLCNYLQSVLPHSTTATLIASYGSSPLAILERRADIVESFSVAAEQLSPIVVALRLARKLVQLALCLERVNNNKSRLADLKLNLGASNDTIARRFVNAACHVTCHDSVLRSPEGIELLMLQSSFETCVGNLQSAWLTLRRALNIAQLMNFFQRAGQTWQLKKETWLRLVHFDRVLSLMLGQRASADGDNLTNGLGMSNDTPSTRLESAHTAILGRIISRNLLMQERIQRDVNLNDDYDDYQETQNIDQELKRAMRSLPQSWWNQQHMPTSEAEAASLLGQIHHFDLLVLVHQPYLIQGPHSQYTNAYRESNEYNKLAAVSASREILNRALLCGDNRDVPCSLSGLSHKAFTACVTLLLAHMQGHSLGCENLLEHQRPLDRTVIQKVIDLFGDILPINGSSRSWDPSVLRKLLDIEEEAANGKPCIAEAGISSVSDEQNGCQRGDIKLQFSIPYLGRITVACYQTRVAELPTPISIPNYSGNLTLATRPPLKSISGPSVNPEFASTCPVDQSDPFWDFDILIEPDAFQ